MKRHHSILRITLFLAAVLVSLYFLSTPQQRSAFAQHINRITNAVLLPARIAHLSTKDPDPTIRMPVEGALVEGITDTWHAPRGTNRLHEGQDVFADRNTAVYAANNGYVVRIGENQLGGTIVFTVGAGRWFYYYAHLEAVADGVYSGMPVTTNTVIGYVGTSGNAAGTPPHLHFGVYTPSGAINPLPRMVNR